MKILLATDGSAHSEMAAKTLRALNPPSDAEIVVLHVMEPPYYVITPVVPPPYNAEWHRVQLEMQVEAEEAASQAIEKAEQILADVGAGTTSIVGEGHPADEITSTAREIEADLVVVGSKGLTGSPLFMLGSVSQKVIKYAPCSVLITKPLKEPNEPKATKVLLATDGSENANAAAKFLSSFRMQEGSEIVVLHVIQRKSSRIPRSGSAQQALEQIRQLMHENAEKLIEDTKRNLSTEAKITTTVKEGDPAEEIIETASEVDADMIVVGSKGLGAIKQFLLGSVSQRVSRYSSKSVMLVKMRRNSTTALEG